MTTIRDVAREAGVSVQTVSNVIHNRPLVLPQTQQRVREAIKRLDFYPNHTAQGLRRRSSQALGFFVFDPNPRWPTDPLHAEVMAGLTNAARAADYGLLVYTPEIPADAPVRDFLRPFQTRRIDAAVITLAGMVGSYTAVVDELVRANVPFAVLEQEVDGESAYCALGANQEGAYAATQLLIESGHKRVVFLESEQLWPAVELRLRGYRAAMKDYGLERFACTATSPDWSAKGGELAMQRLLAKKSTRPTAVLAGNDVLAVGAMAALRANGIRVPDDMAIIGFDDFEFARYINPSLTTVRLPAYEMGQGAAKLLVRHLQGDRPSERKLVFPTELVVRQSTGG